MKFIHVDIGFISTEKLQPQIQRVLGEKVAWEKMWRRLETEGG